MCRYLIQSGANVNHVASVTWWIDDDDDPMDYMYVPNLGWHTLHICY